MIIGKQEFTFDGNHVHIMGILNVTPDSFSDGGKFTNRDKALRHVEQMMKEGADIIDVGGESTRPGYQKITVEEEIERVTEMIRLIKKEFSIPVSIDTYKAPVMDAAFRAGADMANDIWGLRYDQLFAQEGKSSVWDIGTLADVVAKHQKPVCIMHNRPQPIYEDFLEDVLSDLKISVQIAREAGIAQDNIILDPGIGFGKTYENNLMILANLDVFHTLGYPLLLAASRKSVIGLTLDLPVDEREEGTMATTMLACEHRWDMVRVHDVEKNYRTIKMLEQIYKYQSNIS